MTRRASVLQRAKAVARLGRPHFLAGGFVLYATGAALAVAHGAPLNMGLFVVGQLTVTAGQLMTHYSNEWVDLPTDSLHRDRPRWSGGSGVLPAGTVAADTAKVAALVFGVLAILAAGVAVLGAPSGPPSAGLLSASLVLAWGYSAPPLSLHRRGMGEVAGAVLLAILTPLVGYVLQGGEAPVAAVALLAPLAALQFAMLVIVSLPDAPHDAAVGKRTLAVRLGVTGALRIARWAYVVAFALAAGLAAADVTFASPPLASQRPLGFVAALGYWLWSPLAAWQILALGRRQWTVSAWDALALRSIVVVVGAAATLAVAAWLGAPQATLAKTPAAAAPEDELVIAWTGDVTFARRVGEFVTSGGDPLAPVAPLLDTADIVVGNLEGPLTAFNGPTFGLDLSGPPRAASLLAARYDVLTLQNNHALDRGPVGLADTVRHLDAAGVRVLTPTEPSMRLRGPSGSGVTLLAADLAAAFGRFRGSPRETDGVVLALLHGGTEGQNRPDSAQRAAAAALVARGADAVIGVGPHVVQPVAWLPRPGAGQALVAYSLGNFLFDALPVDERRGTILFTGIGPEGILWSQQFPTVTDGRMVRPAW